MTDLQERPADSRDMYMVHTMFRREFAEAPALARAVVDQAELAARVSAHLVLVTRFLHGHHRSEDDVLWPKLLERSPQATRALVDTMETSTTTSTSCSRTWSRPRRRSR